MARYTPHTNVASITELTTSQADDLALLTRLDLMSVEGVDRDVSKEVIRDDDVGPGGGEGVLRAALVALKDAALNDPSAEQSVALRDAAAAALSILERSQQTLDYYKTQYRRVSQEKNGLVDSVKKLRTHVNACKPAVDDLKVRPQCWKHPRGPRPGAPTDLSCVFYVRCDAQGKYESLLKKESAARMERDKLKARVRLLEEVRRVRVRVRVRRRVRAGLGLRLG